MEAKKNMKKNKIKNRSGFSLLEMVISIFIFVVVILTAVSIFANMASARQEARRIQKNMEDARTALDLMAKNMRMSTGLGPDGNGSEIYMFNTSQEVCIRYQFDDRTLKMGEGNPPAGTTNCDPGSVTYSSNQIVSSNNATDGSFEVTQTSTTADPKVIGRATVTMTIDGVRLQTTVSFRDYNGIVQ